MNGPTTHRQLNLSSPAISAWLLGLVLALLGFALIRELQVEWRVNPQYSYGWGVPWLALYLVWKRWEDRPAPEPGMTGLIAFSAGGILLFSLLPIRLVQEANPDWRLSNWLFALSVVGLWLHAAWWAGGWPWLKHFGVAIAFLLVSVPWPSQFEQGLTQSLMRTVTVVTSEGMNWLGIATWTRGNLIELPNGTIGINEACSGLRSFQTLFMLGLFCGELFRLPIWRRLGLVVFALATAFVLNVGRTTVLTWICAKAGPATQARWHDPMGYAALLAGLAIVWSYARWRSRRTQQERSARSLSSEAPRRFPQALAAGVLAWLLLCEGTVQAWYRLHESGSSQERASWTVVWPGAEAGFENKPLPDEIQRILRCDEAASGIWNRPDGAQWTVFYLKWLPGRLAAQLARGHTPDVCLPANGFKLVETLGSFQLEAGSMVLPFNTYVFMQGERRFYVFFCLMDDQEALTLKAAQRAARTYLDELEPGRRLRAAWQGKRQRGQQVLEIAATGYATEAEARAALQKSLPGLLRVKG